MSGKRASATSIAPERSATPVRPHFLGQELDIGVLLMERSTEPRKRVEACAPVVTDPQTADLTGPGAPRGRDSGIGLGERAPRAREQRTTGFGQLDLAAAANEQAGSDLLFELANRDAERRLRHLQTLAARLKLLKAARSTAC
jgi:hypothetical protein